MEGRLVATTVEDVFVSGGQPTITFVERSEMNYERDIRRALKNKNEVLAVSGPSKSGKSTLIHRALRVANFPYVEMSGSSIASVDDFWRGIAYQLQMAAATQSSTTTSVEEATSFTGTVGGGPLPAKVDFADTETQGRAVARADTFDNTHPLAVRNHLLKHEVVLLVDDFHHAPEDARLAMAREIKSLIFAGVRVVLLAIPHRLMDLLRTEGELTGRVNHLRIQPWEEIELARIPMQGLPALRLTDAGGRITARLAREAKGNPLLMQKLCLRVCYDNNIEEQQDAVVALLEPHWPSFLSSAARSIKPSVVEGLVAGATERRRRSPRHLKAGGTVDIYQAVIMALHQLLPKSSVACKEISDQLSDLLTARPQLAQIRSTCSSMARIAEEQRGDGDVSLNFSGAPVDQMNIVDPYLAFYLQWGLHDLGLPPGDD